MNLSEYQNFITCTAIYPGKGKPLGLAYVALGLAGGSGKVAEKIKKVLQNKAGVVDDEVRLALQKELGDVFWYLAAVASELGLDLDEVAKADLCLAESFRQLSPRQIIDMAKQQGVSVAQLLRQQRGIPELTRDEAIAQYRAGEITEERLAECLGVDRLEARRIVQEEKR